MKDQIKKLTYLRVHGRGLEPRTGQEIAKRLGIGKSTWSAYASENSSTNLPGQHDKTLGGIFGFDPVATGWRTDSFDGFRTCYEKKTAPAATAEGDYAAQIEAAYRPRILLAGDNRRPFLTEVLERALRVLRGDAAFCDGLDAESLAREVVALQQVFADLDSENAVLVAVVFPEGLRAEMAAIQADCGGRIPAEKISGPFLEMLKTGLKEAQRLLTYGGLEPNFRASLERLKSALESAVSGGGLDIGWLSDEISHAEQRDRTLFNTGARALRCAIGLRIDAAPDFTVFADGTDPWMPHMIVLPTGRFMMGSTAEEQARFDLDENWRKRESPRHGVDITARFALGRYPVTFEEYDAYCRDSGAELPDDADWGLDRRPVINVSHGDAVGYCDWLSARTGAYYRLPSEAEWEYACRAGTDTAYWWGDDWDGTRANGDGNSEKTSVADAYPPNPWGLHDMQGNVREWCADHWEDNYSTPRSQAAFMSGDASSLRVRRGGSWSNLPRILRSANRSRDWPGNRSRVIGFRLARTLLPLDS